MDEELLAAWDELDRAIRAVLVSLPAQMTETSVELDIARKRFSKMVATVNKASMQGPNCG